jgi:hypothetical protein
VGVIGAEEPDAAPVPILFVAVTVNVQGVTFVSLLMVIGIFLPLAIMPSGLEAGSFTSLIMRATALHSIFRFKQMVPMVLNWPCASFQVGLRGWMPVSSIHSTTK